MLVPTKVVEVGMERDIRERFRESNQQDGC